MDNIVGWVLAIYIGCGFRLSVIPFVNSSHIKILTVV